MKSRWDFANLRWKDFGQSFWKAYNQDRVLAQAAQLSFYFLLAVFPFLIFLAALLGVVLHSTSTLHEAILKYLHSVAPDSVVQLLDSTLKEVSSGASGGKLSFGLIGSLWFASSGMAAIIDSLNIVYDVPEARAWWKRQLVALGLTIAFAVLSLTAFALLVYGPALLDWLAARVGFGGIIAVASRIFEWALVLLLVVVALNSIYIYAPNVKHHHWHWLMPGTVTGVLLWILVSYAFKVYLNFFNLYTVTYGSLGAVIILLLWFYFTGIAILIGAEVNSLIENRQTRKPEQKEKGPRKT